MNEAMVTYVAARLYLQYCRKYGHNPNLSDAQIIQTFTVDRHKFFVSSWGRRSWIERATEAIKAKEDWLKEHYQDD